MKTQNKNNNQLQELITKKENAKRLFCTPRHIDNLTARGIIVKIKVGNLSRYDWNDVVARLKAQSVEVK